jgi:hypothetical protein
MQNVSATLETAILARERSPICRVKVDWARNGYGADGSIDDLTADVTSIDVKRALNTDVPAGVRAFKRSVFSGNTAANATVELAHRDPGGDESKHAGWYYSPYNTSSPLYGFARKGAPCTIEVGFRTTAGDEYVTLLVGTVRRLRTSSRNRTAALEVVDLSETMRKGITLPMVVSDDGAQSTTAQCPGLTGSFFADYIFRSCGYYASPPIRSTCMLSATMHGSAFPEVGSISVIHGANYSELAFPPDTFTHPTPAPKFVAGVNLADSNQTLAYGLAGVGWTINNGGRLFVEGWFYLRDYVGSTGNGAGLWSTFVNGQATPFVSAWVDSSGFVQCNFHRGGADTSHAAGQIKSGVTLNTWHYIGMYFEWASTSVKIWARVDGATAGPVTVNANTQAAPNFNEFHPGYGLSAGSFAPTWLNGVVEAVQATKEDGAGSPPAWNNAFSPTAIVMAGKNHLLANPATDDEQAWGILQKLAEAENGWAGFTETGVPFFRSRDFFAIPPQTISQRTLRSTDAITDIDTDESVDSIRNHIVVHGAVPMIATTRGDVWRLEAPWGMPPGGTLTVWANFDNPAFSVSPTIVYAGTGLQSRYLAARARDGTGGAVSNLSFNVTIWAQSAKIVITNPNAFDVYMVAPTGSGNPPGAPFLVLCGLPVYFTDPSGANTSQRQEASDQTSIDTYGEQLYQERAEDNVWLQDQVHLGQKAADLLAQLKDGKPSVQNLTIVADPRLQLGDRVTLVDSGGVQINEDQQLAEINTSFTSGDDAKLVQTISTRPV